MENGANAYQMRTSCLKSRILRSQPSLEPSTSFEVTIPRALGDQRRYFALLLILLVTGALSCFGTAYYLITNTWEGLHYDLRLVGPGRREGVERGADEEWIIRVPSPPSPSGEKYLTYLPHSGFHNQRIALENALALSAFLNRTLLLPPARLGAAVRYMPFDRLGVRLGLAGKDGLAHCAHILGHTPGHTKRRIPPVPLECIGYEDHTHIPWRALVDLAPLERDWGVRLAERWNMSTAWPQETLGILSNDTLTLRDEGPYDFRFTDASESAPTGRYRETIPITSLAHAPERLLSLGTLFGTARLHLTRPSHRRLRRAIRTHMAPTHPALVRAASTVREALGTGYIGAHVRVGDGKFAEGAEGVVRRIWWRLVCGVLGMSEEEGRLLERVFNPGAVGMGLPSAAGTVSVLSADNDTQTGLACPNALHTTPSLMSLNMPLFISTDERSPRLSPLFTPLLRIFPCAFFLSDFPHALTPLSHVHNADDGLDMSGFWAGLVDGMVVAGARGVVGTEGSTFSRFVEDVLWREYHGLDIVSRG